MNKLIVILTAALGLTMSAYANIGDTRHQSDKRYGTPQLQIMGDFTYRNYVKGNWNVSTGFNTKGYCVYVEYSHIDASNFSKEEIAKLLTDNAIDAKHPFVWYEGNPKYATWWDGLEFYAAYVDQPQTYPDGRTRIAPALRISNRATLTELGLLLDKPPQNSDVNDSI
jgi:hypothetical protein